MISRTTFSSMIVSTATQSGLDNVEIVGLRKAGNSASSESSLARGTFIFKPTFSSACNAPFNIIANVSTFCFFHASFHDFLFAINCGKLRTNSSTIRRLFAFNDEPVSVNSTIASTNSGALTSVAPQENSTSAVTPFFFNHRRVASTNSVATRLPCKSLTDLMVESFGTASTHRAGFVVALL